MRISVVTPTCNRPHAFGLLERFVARQTLKPDEWIVADGGSVPAKCTAGQIHVHEPRPPGTANFVANLLNGVTRATGDVVVFFEDDDHYSATHLETLAIALSRPGALLAGHDVQNYYNLPARRWRTFHNTGASLCQTAMRRGAVDLFRSVVDQCSRRKSYGIDTTLWKAVPTAQWAMTGQATCVGIKGLPGQVGLGIGHRPGAGWNSDPGFAKLREWIGDDVALYI